jgi:hypothetical protein
MAELNLISHLKPTLDEIISVVIRFPVRDPRREQLWSLIIKDEDLTRQLVTRLQGSNAIKMVSKSR